MIGGNASSRRADDFDALVSGRAKGAPSDQYADLLDLVGALRAVEAPVARPAFVADLRERLVVEATANPVERLDPAAALRLTPKQRRGGRERRLAAVLGGFAVVAATGSMAVASQSSLPGDVLYPIKRAIENAHANVQSSPDGKASVLLHSASTRLSEVEQLTQRHDSSDADEISSTLQTFKDQTNQGTELAISDFSDNGDRDGLSQVRSFANSSMDRLAALDDALPAQARPALIAAAQTVKSIDSAAYNACPTCSGAQLMQLPDFATKQLSSALKAPLQGLTKGLPAAVAPTKAPSGAKSGTGATGAPGVPALPGLGVTGGGGILGSGTGSQGGPSGSSPSPSGTTEHKHGIVTGTVDGLTKALLGSSDSDSQSGTNPTPTESPSPGLVSTLTGLLGLNSTQK